MKRIKQLLVASILALNIGFIAVPALASAATPKEDACTAIGAGATCTTSTGGVTLNGVIKAVINILSIVVGIAAVVMIIIGGMKYITSGGDSNSVTSAKNTIIYALIGLVIVVMAQFIVQFVLNKATNTPTPTPTPTKPVTPPRDCTKTIPKCV